MHNKRVRLPVTPRDQIFYAYVQVYQAYLYYMPNQQKRQRKRAAGWNRATPTTWRKNQCEVATQTNKNRIANTMTAITVRTESDTGSGLCAFSDIRTSKKRVSQFLRRRAVFEFETDDMVKDTGGISMSSIIRTGETTRWFFKFIIFSFQNTEFFLVVSQPPFLYMLAKL